MKVDVVCPLYGAERYIDALLIGIRSQKGIELGNVVFPVTKTDRDGPILEKIAAAGFSYFLVPPAEFSHSLTREKAIMEACENEIVIMLSQDIVLSDENAFSELAGALHDGVVYVYGRQICKNRTIERYVRMKNYGDESFTVSAADVKTMQLKAFFASDAFAAYHRPTFLSLGGYGHVGMMMNEDMFYAKKVLDAGFSKGYVATARVEHSHKFKLKELYHRYLETGKWFRDHPEFDGYQTTDTGLKLAFFVLGQALKRFDLPVLFRWLPDMAARYLGMKKGKKVH